MFIPYLKISTFYLALFSTIQVLIGGVNLSDPDTLEWKLRKDNDGINVYTTENNTSKFNWYKTEVILDVKISTLIGIITDTSITNELSMNSTTKRAKTLSQSSWYSWSTIDSPWPFDNRDVILRHQLVQNPETKEVFIYLECSPEFVPKEKACIRVKKAAGFWKFTPVEDGKTKMTYQFYLDPGGNIPAWFSNIIFVEGPFYTFRKIKEIVQSGKHNDITIDYISDF